MIAELRVALFCFDNKKMLTTTQTGLFEESKYVKKNLFSVSLSVQVSIRIGIASLVTAVFHFFSF